MRELGLTELNNALSCLHPSLYIPDAVARVTWYTAVIYVLSLLFSNLVYALVTTRRLTYLPSNLQYEFGIIIISMILLLQICKLYF